MSPWAALAATFLILLLGAYGVMLLDALAARLVGQVPAGPIALRPLAWTTRCLRQQQITTERPDLPAWRLAPALYLGLAATGLALVPIANGQAPVEVEAGIVAWGAVEALTVVAVFLHGWSSNSLLPLIGAYRFVAVGLSILLVSMFVLIAAALPARSLDIGAIVQSQREVWNLVRQPLGLPLFLLLGLALSLRGPLNYADPADLAGGTSAEDTAGLRIGWQVARAAMLVSFAGIASAVFLGGPLGPVLPGPVWLLLKMALLLVVLVAAGHLIARPSPARMMSLIWLILLPLSFLDLVLAGLLVLRPP